MYVTINRRELLPRVFTLTCLLGSRRLFSVTPDISLRLSVLSTAHCSILSGLSSDCSAIKSPVPTAKVRIYLNIVLVGDFVQSWPILACNVYAAICRIVGYAIKHIGLWGFQIVRKYPAAIYYICYYSALRVDYHNIV